MGSGSSTQAAAMGALHSNMDQSCRVKSGQEDFGFLCVPELHCPPAYCEIVANLRAEKPALPFSASNCTVKPDQLAYKAYCDNTNFGCPEAYCNRPGGFQTAGCRVKADMEAYRAYCENESMGCPPAYCIKDAEGVAKPPSPVDQPPSPVAEPPSPVADDAKTRLAKLGLTKEAFESLSRNSQTAPTCTATQTYHDYYSYENLIKAAEHVPDFINSGNDLTDKLELAAFLAHTGSEAGGGWANNYDGWLFCFAHEAGCNTGVCATYVDANHPAEPGKSYYGRGAIQLSWNYNYSAYTEWYHKQTGDTSKDFLKNPELVLQDYNGFMTALFFWMNTTTSTKPTIHDTVQKWSEGITRGSPIKDNGNRDASFAYTTNIINGGIECSGGGNQKKNEVRSLYFNTVVNKMNFQLPGSVGSLNCSADSNLAVVPFTGWST